MRCTSGLRQCVLVVMETYEKQCVLVAMDTYEKQVKPTDATIPSIDTRILPTNHASRKCCGVGVWNCEVGGRGTGK